jgi:hypothetical protein
VTTNAVSIVERVDKLRSVLREALLRSTRWIEAHYAIALASIVVVYLLAALGYSLAAPLWHDELFTSYISQLPTLKDVLHASRTVDLNPPLSYLLTRASFTIFGTGTLQCRLPEILGFALAIVCLSEFVRHRRGPAYGLLAAALLVSSKAGELSIQARPYGLLLGFTALALVAWQRCSSNDLAKRRSPILHALLFCSLTALLLSHVFGLFAWTAITIAEAAQSAAQSIEQRKISTPRWLAVLLPLGATLTYQPLLYHHGVALFPAAFQPQPLTIFEFYIAHIDRELVCLLLTALVVVLISGRTWLRGSPGFGLTMPEWIAVASLIAIPCVLILCLILRHGAFFDRYGIVAALGLSIFFAIFLCWWAGGRPAVAIVAAVLALLISSRIPDAITTLAGGRIFHTANPTIPPSHIDALVPTSLPLVDASGLTFVEMQPREPLTLLQRTFYLTGGQDAIDFAHATIFEGMPEEARLLNFPAHVDSYTQFVAAHPKFYVLGTYDYPEDWLLPKLLADGAQLRLAAHITSSYKDRDLYEVTLNPSPAPTAPKP